MIEFALVSLPFIFLLFAIIELGLIFFANMALANATLSLARQIRVGKLTAPGKAATTSAGIAMDLADFKKAICNNMKLVPTATCLNQLQIDMHVEASLQNQTTASTGSGSNFNTSSFCFYSGSPGDIVVLRAYYLWDIQTPGLLAPLAPIKTMTTSSGNTTGSFFPLISSEVFRNEPNSATTNNGSGC
ncbi:MAG: pilus assembly protein [Pseudomonadota bacterium]|nr:pilus assembly protein [Pseudomonadota bacterium]